MPVNCRGRGRIAKRTTEVDQDIHRVETIWSRTAGTWLFGEFCAADIMFAPVAARFQTYDVALVGQAEQYMKRLLLHPLVREWFRLGEHESAVIEQFELPSR